MSLTFKLEGGDIVFNQDNRLQMTEEIAQSFKVLLETQFESDFRDPNYGCKLQELMQSQYTEIEELIQLYIVEALIQHPSTDTVTSVVVTKTADRSYSVDVTVLLKDINQTITISGVIING